MNALARHPAVTRAPHRKRELLIAAAGRLFAAHGFDGTSTQQIAREAGVSEGILFHHFGSKKGLLEAVAEDFVRTSSAEAMPEALAQLTEEAIVRRTFDFADANPALYELLERHAHELGEGQRLRQQNIVVSAIRRNLDVGMGMGRVRKGDAAILAELQFALVSAAYRAWRRDGQPERREAIILETVRCMRAMLMPGDVDTRACQGRNTRESTNE
ncbi:MAG: TetR/AcrR family transcriptional regulator [Pseudomonadales bacterium]|nr:TetR/AcrR family transcriptional regulator [Pseudomonadales bacterium]MCP5184457.1 TetR/AcrR family transcriptional regulator [Pseudomonadales bacterium]